MSKIKNLLAGDILGNTLYYSLIGAGNPKYLWPKVAMKVLSEPNLSYDFIT